jgi:hypothetical protein
VWPRRLAWGFVAGRGRRQYGVPGYAAAPPAGGHPSVCGTGAPISANARAWSGVASVVRV